MPRQHQELPYAVKCRILNCYHGSIGYHIVPMSMTTLYIINDQHLMAGTDKVMLRGNAVFTALPGILFKPIPLSIGSLPSRQPATAWGRQLPRRACAAYASGAIRKCNSLDGDSPAAHRLPEESCRLSHQLSPKQGMKDRRAVDRIESCECDEAAKTNHKRYTDAPLAQRVAKVRQTHQVAEGMRKDGAVH